VQFGQPSSKRQPETSAFVFTRGTGIYSTKWLQGDVDLVRRHPHPCIAHFEHDTDVCGMAAGDEH